MTSDRNKTNDVHIHRWITELLLNLHWTGEMGD